MKTELIQKSKTHITLTAIVYAIALAASIFIAFTTDAKSKQPMLVEADISYGDLERQKYDLYYPKHVTASTPVLFFIYGGSWDSGERIKYDFVGRKFAKKGFITAIPDYRLYPQVRFPTFVEDTALAFAKVRNKLGTNRPFFVSGHSAGAQIGALLTLDKRYLARHGISTCSSINGFMGLAGPYDFLPLNIEKFFDVFPTDTRTDTQAVNFTNSKAPPVLLLHGATDETVYAEDSEILGRKLNANGNKAEVKIYPRITHVTIMLAVAPMMGLLAPTTRDMVKFMRANQTHHGC